MTSRSVIGLSLISMIHLCLKFHSWARENSSRLVDVGRLGLDEIVFRQILSPLVFTLENPLRRLRPALRQGIESLLGLFGHLGLSRQVPKRPAEALQVFAAEACVQGVSILINASLGDREHRVREADVDAV